MIARVPGPVRVLIVMILTGAGLTGLASYDYLLFHTTVEVFSMVIAFSAFVVVWNARYALELDYLLLLGIGLFSFTVLDVPRMLAFQGLDLFPNQASDLTTQLYVAQRYMLAFTFLVAPAFVGRRLNLPLALTAYGAFTAGVLASTLAYRVFPTVIVQGQGPTLFKTVIEYVIAVLLVGSLFTLNAVSRRISARTVALLGGALLAFLASQVFFALLGDPLGSFPIVDPFGAFDLLGHLAQVLAFALVYGAIVVDGLTRPYSLLYRELSESERRFRATFEQAAVGFAQVGRQGKFRQVNDRYAEMLGYQPKEIEPLRLGHITHPDEIEHDLAMLRDIREGTGDTDSRETRYVHRDGTTLWVRQTVSAVRDNRGNIDYFVLVVEDITRRKIAEDQRRRLLDELEAVRAITDIALSSLRTDELLANLLGKLTEVLQADGAVLLVLEGDRLTALAVEGFDTADLSRLSPSVGDGPIGTVATSRRPVHMDELTPQGHKVEEYLSTLGVRGILAVPLIHAESVIGVLHVDWKVRHTFDPEELRVLGLAADRIALALVNAQLYEETAEANALGKALNRLNATLHSSLQVEEIMRQAVEGARSAAEVDAALIATRHDGAWELRYESGLPEARSLSLDESESALLTMLVQTRRPFVSDDLYSDTRFNLSLLKKLSLRSGVFAPLLVRDTVIGVLALFYRDEPRRFSQAKIDFARRLSTSLALGIENARLYEGERHVAETLQDALISVPTEIEHIRIAHTYMSATEAARVGGDFYDVFETVGGCIGILIGDVSGKGVEAAVLTSLVRNVVRAHSLDPDLSTADVVARTNEVVNRESPGDVFVTLIFCVFDAERGVLRYCNAGHPTGLLKRHDSRIARLPATSPVIGAIAEARYDEAVARLHPMDTLYLYTDGLVEARSGKQFLGEERLASIVMSMEDSDMGLAVQAILDEVISFAGQRLTDDAALLAVRWMGVPTAVPSRGGGPSPRQA